MTTSIDPVFAAIADVEAAHKARETFAKANITDRASEAAHESELDKFDVAIDHALWHLARAVPTTAVGAAAKLRFAIEIIKSDHEHSDHAESVIVTSALSAAEQMGIAPWLIPNGEPLEPGRPE